MREIKSRKFSSIRNLSFYLKKTISCLQRIFVYLNESLIYILNKMIFFHETDNRMKTIIKKKIFGGDVQFLTNYNLFTFGISFCFFIFFSFFFVNYVLGFLFIVFCTLILSKKISKLFVFAIAVKLSNKFKVIFILRHSIQTTH